MGRPVRGHIENDRWYEIRIALNGSRVRCYLDGELIHDATAPASQKFFAVAGRDDDTGDILLKAINVGDETVSANLKLLGVQGVARAAQVTVLKSADLSDNNSLDKPAKVLPSDSRIENASTNFSYEFQGGSLTVLRLKAH